MVGTASCVCSYVTLFEVEKDRTTLFGPSSASQVYDIIFKSCVHPINICMQFSSQSKVTLLDSLCLLPLPSAAFTQSVRHSKILNFLNLNCDPYCLFTLRFYEKEGRQLFYNYTAF